MNKAYLDMINSEEYIKLYNYYNQKTFMDVLGSSRRENDHSNFLAWLFNPSENHGMGDYPLRKLLQTIAFRCNKSGYKSTNPQNFLNTKNIACLNNLIYDDFEIESARISREYPTINKQRLDLYIELEIKFESEKENKKINLLIENKVTSPENNNQTVDYINWLFGQSCEAIPIYLIVAKNNKLECLKKKQKPKSDEFMVLNYQYLLDGVFEPCLLRCKTEFGCRLLKEYVICLGKALNPEDGNSKNRALVMAVSKYEKNLVHELWKHHEDALIRQFDKYGMHLVEESKETEQFYVAIAETLSDLIENGRISLEDDNKKQTIQRMRELNTTSRIYFFNNNLYQKHKRPNTLGALCRDLIREYADNKKTLKELNDIVNKTKLTSCNWLRGVIVKKSDVGSLDDCKYVYDFDRKSSDCTICPDKDKMICCRNDLKHSFFTNEPVTTTDGNELFIARFFGEDNLKKLIKELNFSKDITIY